MVAIVRFEGGECDEFGLAIYDTSARQLKRKGYSPEAAKQILGDRPILSTAAVARMELCRAEDEAITKLPQEPVVSVEDIFEHLFEIGANGHFWSCCCETCVGKLPLGVYARPSGERSDHDKDRFLQQYRVYRDECHVRGLVREHENWMVFCDPIVAGERATSVAARDRRRCENFVKKAGKLEPCAFCSRLFAPNPTQGHRCPHGMWCGRHAPQQLHCHHCNGGEADSRVKEHVCEATHSELLKFSQQRMIGLAEQQEISDPTSARPKRILFGENKISDAKRLVRAEQYLFGKSLLESAGLGVRPRILTMAGGHPSEEISAIRILWPNSSIVSCDDNSGCLRKAKEAGADVLVLANVLNFEGRGLPRALATAIGRERFDIINLDLCGIASVEKRNAIERYFRVGLKQGGLIMLTFGYGHDHDVLPVARMAAKGTLSSVPLRTHRRLIAAGIPEKLIERVTLLSTRQISGHASEPACIEAGLRYTRVLQSAYVYRGNQTPMCSVMWQKRIADHRPAWPEARNNSVPGSWVKVSDEDLDMAVGSIGDRELVGVYLPDERASYWRRKIVARKAVATRRAREVEVQSSRGRHSTVAKRAGHRR